MLKAKDRSAANWFSFTGARSDSSTASATTERVVLQKELGFRFADLGAGDAVARAQNVAVADGEAPVRGLGGGAGGSPRTA